MNVNSISINQYAIFQGKNPEITNEKKQEIILKARTKACGWAVFGGTFSTLYYALRSDKKVADKFGLDIKEDKKLIKQIKKEQIKWTLPSALSDIFDLGAHTGILDKKYHFISLAISGSAYLYNKFIAKPKNIKVD